MEVKEWEDKTWNREVEGGIERGQNEIKERDGVE